MNKSQKRAYEKFLSNKTTKMIIDGMDPDYRAGFDEAIEGLPLDETYFFSESRQELFSCGYFHGEKINELNK